MSKLGVHIISLGSTDAVDWFSHAKPAVALISDHNTDTVKTIKQVSPYTFIVGRLIVDDGEQVFLDNPEQRAEAFFNRMLPDMQKMAPWYSAWVAYNEPVIHSADEAKALSRFYVRWGNLMRGAGFKSAAYSFSTGNPENDLWQYLGDGLKACDFLSLHEYSAPTMDSQQGWLCLRYRQAMKLLPPDSLRPVIITETGIDGGVIGQPQEGWRLVLPNEDDYLNTLHWYDSQLQADSYVIGATIFTLDGWGKKGSFSIIGANKIRDYIGSTTNIPTWSGPAVVTPPAPPPIPQPVPTTEGWCPFAIKKPLPTQYTKGRDGWTVRAVVLHIAEGPLTAIYPTFTDPNRKASTHFAIGKDGTIEQYVSILDTAWGNGKVNKPTWDYLIPNVNPNLYTLSIEHEGHYQDQWTPQMYDANNRLLRWLEDQFNNQPRMIRWMYVPHNSLIGHCEIDSVDRANCPGPNVDYVKIAADANANSVWGLEPQIRAEAQKQKLMPINHDAALWKYAHAQGLGDQQSDEFTVTYNGADYIAQVYDSAIVYVKKGDWGNIHQTDK